MGREYNAWGGLWLLSAFFLAGTGELRTAIAQQPIVIKLGKVHQVDLKSRLHRASMALREELTRHLGSSEGSHGFKRSTTSGLPRGSG
jgi:hypothetical protein